MRKVVPVYGVHGGFQLWDKFVDGKWCGSRRTIEQCTDDFGTWCFAINPDLI